MLEPTWLVTVASLSSMLLADRPSIPVILMSLFLENSMESPYSFVYVTITAMLLSLLRSSFPAPSLMVTVRHVS